jgi:glycerol transport system ATP-binding protein
MSLKLENVTKTVGGETHIDKITLDLSAGTLHVLIGPTLAGKTSLMRLMAGLDRPSDGRILVDGEDVTGVAVRSRSVAMVYQQFINYPSFTVYDNIASPLRISGLSKHEIDLKVREAAITMHIEELLDRLPAELSGGQQQRTAIARALVKDAHLLLLDEPLANLDYKLREELRAEMGELFERRDTIVVYATTEPTEALMLGGTTVILDEGRKLQSGPTLEVFHKPSSIAVANIFSDPPMNMIDGEIVDGEARLGEEIRLPLAGHLGQLSPGPYHFGVRAGHLSVVSSPADEVRFGATVDLAEVSGSETFIHIRHEGRAWVVQEQGVHSFDLGQPIDVFLDAARLFVFADSGRLVAAPGGGGPVG